MTIIFITGFVLASVLMLGLVSALRGSTEDYCDRSYLNSNGDHIYYERSIIEKKIYQRQNPDKRMRSISSLFRFKSSFMPQFS